MIDHRRRGPTRTPGLRVLIAEDIGGSRQLLASLLRQLVPDVELHEVADGADVVETHRRLEPQVTFLDIGLPNRTGLEVLQEIRVDDAASFIVIVSAHSQADVITEAVSLSVDGFVVKPYSPQRIVDALDRFRARH
jgi:two-component system chemotaxis response regulator CheY